MKRYRIVTDGVDYKVQERVLFLWFDKTVPLTRKLCDEYVKRREEADRDRQRRSAWREVLK